MHCWILEHSCVDIDGVLCRDPTEEENDDGPMYEDFLVNAEPLLIPSAPVGWLVTCRLEKYRDLTEQWLANHGVIYRELIMMDLPSKAARIAAGSHARFKAEVYANTNAKLFIESSAWQAYEIANRTGKPVFCLETRRMVTGPIISQTRRNIGQILRWCYRKGHGGARRLWRLGHAIHQPSATK
jgi:orotate phosphoribosyltransferase